MNDNNLNSNQNNNQNNTYKATSNLNTAIENPQINLNSATGINIKDLGNNNYAESNQNNSNNFLNNNINQQNTKYQSNNNMNQYIPNNNNYDSYQNPNTVNYSYTPVMKEKKKDQNVLSSTIHSKEFKIMIFIVFILVLFLLLMPYIYDFFRNLNMSMTA